MNTLKKTNQIKVLTTKLSKRKTTNPYAVKNKIKNLKKEIVIQNKNTAWQNYLAQ